MLPVSIVTLLLVTLPLCLDAFPLQHRGNCTNPSKRRAWHTLGDDQKRAYLAAQKCVMDKPGSLGLPGAKSKFDEMVSNHQILGRSIHATGAFFPYHRYLLHAHELLLEECGYSEGLPYWHERRDAGNFMESDMFDADTGFGSAATGFDMIRDGPFANASTPIGPGWEITDNYLNRNINDTISMWAVREKVDDCMVYDKYEDVWVCLYMAPHRGGHGGVGGTMRDPLTSPGDPVFYLHHTWVDKLWWDWQEADPENRTYDIGGPNTQTEDVGFPEVPGNMTEEDEKVFGKINEKQEALVDSGTRGDEGGEVSLSHVLTTLGVIPDTLVEDIMNTRGGYLCYEYVDEEE